ncbi:MAG TPA: alkaline phosphatase family protein [Vicinamibacteria bacterium]|nr:alkaline phosphatase family protein [Vicinamibacteria bacterium]
MRSLLPIALIAAMAGHAAAERPRVVLLVLRGVSFASAPAPVAARAVPLVPIDGAVTAAAMGTLFTGAEPARHGMVGNVYREGFAGEEADAFAQRMLVEPVWEAAERQGRRVAALNVRLPGYRHDRVEASWTQRPEAAGGSHDASPTAFARDLDEQVGPPPGAADLEGFLDGSVTADAFAAQVERWVLHRRADIRHALARLPFDLLIVDENVADAVLHPFTGREERHAQRARRLAGETIAAVAEALPSDATLLVVSPYGMAPVREAISVARVLEAAGFAVAGRQARLRIAAYGPVAHVYLGSGVEPRPIETALRNARDLASGTPLFDRVERRGAHASLPLFHPVRGGDIVVLARAGTVLSSESGPVAPRFPGDHGHAAAAPGAHGFFFAFAKARPLRLPPSVRDVDVAPIVACLLGIAPPEQAQGRAHSLFEGRECVRTSR